MATFSSDHPVEEEEEVQTEEADPAKTTDEEVRTEEEAIESLLDFNSINSLLNLVIEDVESDKGAESQKPQEDSTMIPRSDRTVTHSSTTLGDQNRLLDPRMSQVMMPLEEQMQRRDETVNSTTFSSDQNRSGAQISLVDSLVTQSPFQQQQRLTYSRNQSFAKQQLLFPTMVTTKKPGWFIRDHSSATAWRPHIIRPNHQHPMVNQLANIEGLQNQTFVPRPLFRPPQTYFVQQPHLNAIALSMYRYYPYMRPEDNPLNLRMPHFRSDLMLTLTSPSGQPRSFVLLQDQFNPHQRFVLSLDDALVFGPILEMDHPQTQQRQHLDFPIDMIHRQASSPNAAAVAWPELNHPQTQQQQFNQGLHFGFPLDMIHHQASPSAAPPPRPQLNHQHTRQLQLQTQYPTQTQRFNGGPYSHQGQDQQQP